MGMFTGMSKFIKIPVGRGILNVQPVDVKRTLVVGCAGGPTSTVHLSHLFIIIRIEYRIAQYKRNKTIN